MTGQAEYLEEKSDWRRVMEIVRAFYNEGYSEAESWIKKSVLNR